MQNFANVALSKRAKKVHLAASSKQEEDFFLIAMDFWKQNAQKFLNKVHRIFLRGFLPAREGHSGVKTDRWISMTWLGSVVRLGPV